MTDPAARPSLGLGCDPDPLFADLIDAVRASAADLGLSARDVRTPEDAVGVGRLLLIGRPGRYRPLLGPQEARDPVRIVWTGEPLPTVPRDASGAVVAGKRASPARRVVRPIGAALRRAPLPGRLDRRRVVVTTDRLLHANLGELAMATKAGARLVVTSRDRAATLAATGVEAAVVPFGYHERHAGPLTPIGAGPRDLGLVMLGSRAGHTRRARQVAGLLRSEAGRDLTVVEGVWGGERAALLRRTRVVVDVHRIPGNFVGLRLLLTLAAGAALVTEPMTDPWPFVPGVHFLEAPMSDLLDVARGLADDEVERARLVDAGQTLLRDSLTMQASLERALSAHAER
jgi:hypothetical protein